MPNETINAVNIDAWGNRLHRIANVVYADVQRFYFVTTGELYAIIMQELSERWYVTDGEIITRVKSEIAEWELAGARHAETGE